MSDQPTSPSHPDDDASGLARRCADLVDDSPYAAARDEATELGARSPDPLSTDTIRLLARLTGARSAVCVSPAPGVPALAVLSATGPSGVVTCIADDPHHVEAARSALAAAGHPASAARFIAARPLEVLDKLADGAYDLVVADVDAHSVARVVARSRALLRKGGALVLMGEHAPLPEEADADGSDTVSVLPVGEGLTVVVV